ncbi:iron-containing alcohol dehydrogenase [Paenibacillus sp. MWE-103]|uniref:Iron-containing alcohol dehydrogenase n=2 Tax=Paenibacillus artemisiicola TaxID=1172618 RepID=A0ABS3WEJ0_9BACL|nr:iron-containing alcohol dehydrogenase [Paenibacillus artemisiicola]
MTRNFSLNGIPGPDVAAYYRRRAEGGVGLIITEGTIINHPASAADHNVPRFFGEDALNGWAHIVNEVHGGLTAMGVSPDWSTHLIEHAVSAVHDIPHGGGIAIIAPHWMEHVAAIRPEKVAQFGVRVFDLDRTGKTDHQLAAEAIQSLKEFWKSIGAPTKLSDYGIDDKEIELMTERAMLADQIGSYVPLTREDVRRILRNSL